jgi:hypothetical protein
VRSLAELLNTPVWVTAGGRQWPLVITHGVLLECGRELGVDAIGGGLDVVNPTARLMRALLWAALARAGADLSLHQAGDLIGIGSLAAMRRVLLMAWIRSMPDPEAPKKPKQYARSQPRLTGLRAWAIARIELGVTDAEWLEMTPRQARELSETRLERMQREEVLVGIIASNVANFGPGQPDPPLQATDFMIHPFEEPEDDSGEVVKLNYKKRGKRNARRR